MGRPTSRVSQRREFVSPRIERHWPGVAALCVMRKRTRKFLLVIATMVLLPVLLLALAYGYQRPKFIQKANLLFDPEGKAFKGVFLPWPIGHPTLFGGLDPDTDRRIRASLGYESGSISTNGMRLVIHDSDGTFF